MSGKLSVLSSLLAIGLALVSGHPKSVRGPDNHKPLIVGGVDATPGEFPYIVRLNIGCGGSLISTKYVLTAAHCAQYPASLYTVVAGEHNLGQSEGTEVSLKVSRVIPHPDYDSNKFISDIALLELAEEIELTDRIQLAPLPPRNFSPTGNSTAAGWGALREGGSSPDILQKVTVPLVSFADCKEAYRELVEGGAIWHTIDETTICAGAGGRDACQGDSGGPMLCDGPDGNVLCGIVSKGEGCAREAYPGVYAKPAYFLDWIEETIAAKTA